MWSILQQMRLPLTILLLTICGTLYAPGYNSLIIERSEGIEPFAGLWEATCKVESSCNPKAHNIKEDARGIVQIREVRLRDYNQRSGSHYTMNDLYDPKISERIWKYYARKFSVYDFEGIAKAWNCNSKAYWMKIKKAMR